MLEADIDALPEWCDRDITRKSMTCCASQPGALELLDRAS